MTDYQPDILKFLEKVVQRNTIAYAEDFDVDKEILLNSAEESSLEHRSFLWMSRPYGTWCVPERETFLRDSRAYKTWTFYADQPNGIKAYRVVVDGVRDGKLAGKIVPVNYARQVQRVLKSALPIAKVQYRDRDDYFCESSYETFIHDVSRTEEKIHDIRYVPKSEAELQSLLMLEHQLEQQDKRPKRTKSVTKQPRRPLTPPAVPADSKYVICLTQMTLVRGVPLSPPRFASHRETHFLYGADHEIRLTVRRISIQNEKHGRRCFNESERVQVLFLQSPRGYRHLSAPRRQSTVVHF